MAEIIRYLPVQTFLHEDGSVWYTLPDNIDVPQKVIDALNSGVSDLVIGSDRITWVEKGEAKEYLVKDLKVSPVFNTTEVVDGSSVNNIPTNILGDRAALLGKPKGFYSVKLQDGTLGKVPYY